MLTHSRTAFRNAPPRLFGLRYLSNTCCRSLSYATNSVRNKQLRGVVAAAVRTYHPTSSLNTSEGHRKVILQSQEERPRRIVVGITGATGTLFAIRLLEILQDLGVETHLVISKWAMATMKYETPTTEADLRELCTYFYASRDVSAPIASGSFLHDGMIIVPCSMKTLAAVRIGYCEDLIARAADVTLKENRKLMLVIRETPLSEIHLENMLHLRRFGATIFPPVPAFYTRPESLNDLIDQSVGRMLDIFDIHTNGFERWNGFQRAARKTESSPDSHCSKSAASAT
ncbi:uncharacterized protein N7483_003000 [Penicillium malachiteum]|uniref:uncharacterized protein n=1 Tax=Penicillium malachiteum TaxID=1324776 RepID=UPI00254690CA|nr:uncharacterized protein N7483_003000 [Penicillium malachiteum]KAJ5737875.1 hypothetical protein N7483_003000 [Penicillium malachiteum]